MSRLAFVDAPARQVRHRARLCWAICLGVSVNSGCDRSVLLSLDVPVDWDRGTELLVVHDEEGVEVFAIPLEGGKVSIPLPVLERAEDTQIEALLYRASPQELGFEPGRIPPATDVTFAFRLPDPDEIYGTRFSRGGSSLWEGRAFPTREASMFWASLGRPAQRINPPECLKLGAPHLVGSIPGPLRQVVSLDREHVAVIGGEVISEVFVIGPEFSIEATGIFADLIAPSTEGTVFSVEGETFSVAEWSAASGFGTPQPVATLPEDAVQAQRVISTGRDSFLALVQLQRSNVILSFDGARLAEFYHFPRYGSLLAALDANTAITSRWASSDTIVETVVQVIDDSGVRSHGSFPAGIEAVGRSAVDSLWLSIVRGQIFQYGDDQWVRLPDASYEDTKVVKIVSDGEVTVLSLEGDQVGQVAGQNTRCALQSLSDLGVPSGGRIAMLGRSLLVVVNNRQGRLDLHVVPRN